MTFRILALAAVTAVAGTAGAFAADSGNDQLALQAGVEPGVYSTAELSRIIQARQTNGDGRVEFILTGANEMPTRGAYFSAPSEPTSTFGTGVHSENR